MREALTFLTPFGRATPPSSAAFVWFPVVGALIGFGVGGVWWAGDAVWTAAVAAALAVTADLAATGMLHFDGLVDSADGLLPPLSRERRLAVLQTPDIGAFGMGAGATVLLVRWAAFAAMPPEPFLVAGLWSASRTMMALIATRLPYARPGGTATPFLGGRSVVVAAAGIPLATALVLAGTGAIGIVALAALAGAGIAVAALARRRIGGFTGDVLGAAGVVGETAGLLAAAAG